MFKILQKKLAQIIAAFFLFFYFSAQAQDFLNTDDAETFSIVNGNGLERGFYFQVTVFLDEQTLPKSSLLPGTEKNHDYLDEESLGELLIKLEPSVVFANNTAECDVFQVYYSTNDMVPNGTNVTYAYLIQVKNKTDFKRCNLKVFRSDQTTLLREIEYFATAKDH